MKLTIRREQPQEYRAVEELTREAFYNHFVPGCAEHYLAHILRDSDAFVKELDLVALTSGRIVGNIMYTRAAVLCDDGGKREVLCFGPLSVLPEYQGKGIGSKLVEHSKAAAKALGYKAVLIFGDPEFYKRLGFVPAKEYSIGTSWGAYAASLLACELAPGALKDCGGRFQEDSVFEIDEVKAEEFDRGFPFKEKCGGLPSQERFAQLVAQNEPMD